MTVLNLSLSSKVKDAREELGRKKESSSARLTFAVGHARLVVQVGESLVPMLPRRSVLPLDATAMTDP